MNCNKKISLMKKYFFIVFSTVCSVLLLQQCNSSVNKIKGIRVSEFYNDCNTNETDFGDLITIGDPDNRFMITLPYKWDTREFYSDTLYGIYASNSLDVINQPEMFYALSVTGYYTQLSLHDYYLIELSQLKSDDKIKVLETGTYVINDSEYPWILFNLDSDIEMTNHVLYIKDETSESIYILQSSVFKGEDDKDKLCQLKQFVSSFEIVY